MMHLHTEYVTSRSDLSGRVAALSRRVADNGKWVTINGRPVLIEKGQTIQQAISRIALNDQERTVLEHQKKHGTEMAILTVDGKETLRLKGKKDHVTWTEAQLAKVEGAVLTHNHPSGASLSSSDYNIAALGRLHSVVAVTADGTRFTGKAMNPLHGSDVIPGERAVFKALQIAKLPPDAFNIVFSHAFNSALAGSKAVDSYTVTNPGETFKKAMASLPEKQFTRAVDAGVRALRKNYG